MDVAASNSIHNEIFSLNDLNCKNSLLEIKIITLLYDMFCYISADVIQCNKTNSVNYVQHSEDDHL